jgi:hypothetical protein
MEDLKFKQIAVGQYTKDSNKGLGTLVYALGEDGYVYQHRHSSGGWQKVDSGTSTGAVVSMPRSAQQAQETGQETGQHSSPDQKPW